ncbi:MAG TPA: oxygen-independent coproporphyrinogen III oxidase [Opitutaceae bacterium]
MSPTGSQPLNVNLDLVRKYNQPGPRYTSYPTAPQFTEEFDRARLAREIEENNRTDRPLSLYFHLPFCETLCWFCGCTTITTKDQLRTAPYLAHLEKELEIMAASINPHRRVTQMHFGGGTPNFFSPAEIRRIGAMIAKHFTFAPGAEVGIEFDPRRLTYEHVLAFRELGGNRASLGIQDFNFAVQEAVNRIQPEEVTAQAISWMRDAGFESINVDLIYGLPLQTVESFADTIRRSLVLSPDRYAVFSYAHVPWMKGGQRVIKEADLPDPDTKLQMLKGTIESLTRSGYAYIGMDHFAKENDELTRAQQAGTLQRNFQGYSTHGGADIYAYGMSAISQTEQHYRQNHKSLPGYYGLLDKGELPTAKAFFLSDDDRIRRDVIMRLMCDHALDFDATGARLGIDFRDYFSSEIERLSGAPVDDDLIEMDGNGLRATDAGRLLIRNLAMHFDTYLKTGQPARYSKTV